MSPAKRELIRLIKQQPANGTTSEVVEELIFYLGTLRGLADAKAGRVVPHAEVVRHFQELAGRMPG